MLLKEKTLAQEYMFKGRIINLRRDDVELPNGHKSIREVVEHKGGVCVLPINDKGEVLLVKQYRYPYMEELLEIPAGKRDHGDESPLECGKRELKEETGATSENFMFLGEFYPSPGYTNEVIYIYLATDLDYGETNPDDDEFLELYKIPFDKALDMVLSGELKDGKTQAAILKASVLSKNGKIKICGENK